MTIYIYGIGITYILLELRYRYDKKYADAINAEVPRGSEGILTVANVIGSLTWPVLLPVTLFEIAVECLK